MSSPANLARVTAMADRYAASPVHAAQRLAILADESARLCAEILAGMDEREAERRAIWAPVGAGE